MSNLEEELSDEEVTRILGEYAEENGFMPCKYLAVVTPEESSIAPYLGCGNPDATFYKMRCGEELGFDCAFYLSVARQQGTENEDYARMKIEEE